MAGMGGNRLAYAASVKAYSIFAKSGANASAFRTVAGDISRYGAVRPYAPDLVGRSDAALRVGAGKTSPVGNVLGATHVGATLYNLYVQP